MVVSDIATPLERKLKHRTKMLMSFPKGRRESGGIIKRVRSENFLKKQPTIQTITIVYKYRSTRR